jgi:CheY-like chemotaxis protein
MTDDLTRILLVDNQVDAREWLAEWLRKHDSFEVQTADNSEQCLERLHATEGKYDVIVMDLVLGKGADGIDTMKEVRQRYPGIEIIIITGFGDRRDGIRAMKAGAYKYVLKPFEREELVAYIRHAAERRKLISEVSRAKIYETFTALRMGRDLPGILDLIVDNLHGLFNLTTCTVMLLDPQKTRLEVVSERGLGKKVVRLISDLPKDLKKVFVNDEPLEIPNLDQREDWKRTLVRTDLKSFTLLPRRDKNGEPLGVVTMGRTSQTVPSSDDEIRLLKGLADQASVAIENARLNDNTTKKAKLLKMLDLASLDIGDPMEVNAVLRTTIERATDLLEASGGAIYLFTSTTKDEELTVRASYGEPLIPEGTVVSKERGVVVSLAHDMSGCINT